MVMATNKTALALSGALLAAMLLLPRCAEDGAGATGDDGLAVAVAPGKADDYLSPTSREFRLWGMGEVALEEEWREKTFEEREAEVQARLGYRFKAYAHFVNVYLTDKSSHDNNSNYGGFAGLVRKTSLDWVREPMDDDGMVWAFIWEVEMGGPRDLLDRLPFDTRDNGEPYLMVTMPVLAESQLRSASYPKDFDPAVYGGETEQIEVVVEPIDESVDAFPAYDELFADGKLDIAVIVGGDYNDKRYDLQAAERIYDWLHDAGFAHETTVWTALTHDAAPFTKTVRVNGADVAVEITLLHPDMVPDAELDTLRERVIAAYETMDIVIYDGHAGQDPDYSGVVYHYNPRHAVSANGLAELNLPAKYQIYVFNGCKTYSAYPEAVYRNETKTTANLDIVSTVNFSWLSMQTFTTLGLINEILATEAGTHDPRTFVELLSKVNEQGNANVYYGVHGLDDNSHRNPYAELSALCAACTTDADCPGMGNRCVRFDWGAVCGAECTSQAGCPEGYGCIDIAAGSRIVGKQCLPDGFSCP